VRWSDRLQQEECACPMLQMKPLTFINNMSRDSAFQARVDPATTKSTFFPLIWVKI